MEVWYADLWRCPKCDHETVAGFGNGPLKEHFEDGFGEWLDIAKAKADNKKEIAMDKATLEKMAVTAFENMTKARAALFEAAEAAIMSRNTLEADKASATVGGVFDGKNAEIREAQAREHLQARYLEVDMNDRAERKARHDFDRASIEVDTVKTLLRIAELV